MKTREEALALLKTYTESDALLKHAYAAEAVMRGLHRGSAGTRNIGVWSACSMTSITTGGRRNTLRLRRGFWHRPDSTKRSSVPCSRMATGCALR